MVKRIGFRAARSPRCIRAGRMGVVKKSLFAMMALSLAVSQPACAAPASRVIQADLARIRPDLPAMREQRPRRPGVVHDWQRCQAVHPALAPAGAGHQDWIEMCRNMKSCDSS